MFSDRIKDLRLENDLVQEDLAKQFKVSRTTISKYENGETEPSLDMIRKYSEKFNVSTDYLLGHTRINLPSPLLYRLDSIPDSSMEKLNKILNDFVKNEKYIDLVYDVLNAIKRL